MKNIASLITCFVFPLACGPYVDPMPVGPDLATAPLGGEYVGIGQLDHDSCNGYDKNSEADKAEFEPFVVDVKMYAENEDHSQLNFNVGQVHLKNVMPAYSAADGIERYIFKHEFVEQAVHLSVLNLDGTVAAGDMHVDLFQKLYDGTKEMRGDGICEVLYLLHAKKVVNYPYVKPSP